VGLVALGALIAFVVDVTQTKQAIRRSYPVIGRSRYLFERLGEFFRQYLFAMDVRSCPPTGHSARGCTAPDFITLDGAEGGTGAAPMALIEDWGRPCG
jgi:hypothetical protein